MLEDSLIEPVSAHDVDSVDFLFFPEEEAETRFYDADLGAKAL